jgi:hypothetical protein
MTRKNAAAPAREEAASRLEAEQLTVSFAIPEVPADHRSATGFVCAVCAGPATGWTRIEGIADGRPVIDGYATCRAHRSREAVEQLLVTHVG